MCRQAGRGGLGRCPAARGRVDLGRCPAPSGCRASTAPAWPATVIVRRPRGSGPTPRRRAVLGIHTAPRKTPPIPAAAFTEWIAERYELLWPELFGPGVIAPAVNFLAELAGGGPALELGIGAGRIALPLSRRGPAVHGIDLPPAMAARLRARHRIISTQCIRYGHWRRFRPSGRHRCPGSHAACCCTTR
jgi:hypothetical protein